MIANADRVARINLNEASALICEQHPAEQDILASILNGFGLSGVVRCHHFHEIMSHRHKPYDLIFVGISANDQDKMEGVAALRRDVDHPSRTSPIVVMSCYTPHRMVERARGAGATFVIAKPLSSQVVFDRILWLSSVTQEFVETASYFGPDRRLRNLGPSLGTTGRRRDDLSADVGQANSANMSQEAIDGLMKPAKVAL